MSKLNPTYRLSLTNDRQFLANAIITANVVGTGVSTNILPGSLARARAFTILLLVAHSVCDSDDDKKSLAGMLDKYGQMKPSPVSQREVDIADVIDEFLDDTDYL